MDATFLRQEIQLAPKAVEEIVTLKSALSAHRVFQQVNDLASLRTFMGVHVFAVWDFMSLLKRLQRDLTCVDVPWLPAADPVAARLMNEIVLQEESDECEDGTNFLSHFEMYKAAMTQVGASASHIDGFMEHVRRQGTFLPPSVWVNVGSIPSDFVVQTLGTAMHGSTIQVLASFVLGREEVIPGMFQALLDAQPTLRERAPTLTYYLERHVTVDSDLHGPAAWKIVGRMLSKEPSKRAEFEQAAIDALQARLQLWDRLSHRLTAVSIPVQKSA